MKCKKIASRRLQIFVESVEIPVSAAVAAAATSLVGPPCPRAWLVTAEGLVAAAIVASAGPLSPAALGLLRLRLGRSDVNRDPVYDVVLAEQRLGNSER